MMYENMVLELRKAADEWKANHPSVPTFETRYDLALKDAADAIETMCEMVATAHNELANVIESYEESKPHWIPVEDRLPENCEDVLAYIERDAWVGGGDAPCRKREIAIAYHVNGRWHVDGCSRVDCIAWMPLPPPPKEET